MYLGAGGVVCDDLELRLMDDCVRALFVDFDACSEQSQKFGVRGYLHSSKSPLCTSS